MAEDLLHRLRWGWVEPTCHGREANRSSIARWDWRREDVAGGRRWARSVGSCQRDVRHREFRFPCSDAANPFPTGSDPDNRRRAARPSARSRSREIRCRLPFSLQTIGTGRLEPNIRPGVEQAAERLHVSAVRTLRTSGRPIWSIS